jgi:hypothetical protein
MSTNNTAEHNRIAYTLGLLLGSNIELVQLVKQLDQQPGNRILILERVADLEAQVDEASLGISQIFAAWEDDNAAT